VLLLAPLSPLLDGMVAGSAFTPERAGSSICGKGRVTRAMHLALVASDWRAAFRCAKYPFLGYWPAAAPGPAHVSICIGMCKAGEETTPQEKGK
jgi:hypothetical protein